MWQCISHNMFTVTCSQFPTLCPYFNATYQIVVEDEDGFVVLEDGPYVKHWRDTNPFATVELRERGLQLGMLYTANITVSTLAGHRSIEIKFSMFIDIPSNNNTHGFFRYCITNQCFHR